MTRYQKSKKKFVKKTYVLLSFQFIFKLHFLFQTIAIQCGAKGNDQIGVASCIKLIDELSSGRKPDFDQFNWQVIPLLNPDGYDYSQTSGNELKS